MADYITRLVRDFFASDGERRVQEQQQERTVSVAQIEAALAESDGNSVIAICCHDRRTQLLTQLVCMEKRITYVPLLPSWPRARIEKLLRIAGASAVLSDQPSSDGTLQIRKRPLVAKPSLNDHPLYIMFTSGSTGEPKGVIISRAAYANFLGWMSDHFASLPARARLLSLTEFTFDVSHFGVALLLQKEACWHFAEAPENVAVVLNELEQLRINVLITVPTLLGRILGSGLHTRFDLGQVTHAILCGCAIPLSLHSDVFSLFPHARIFNYYGPTEATVACTLRVLTGDAKAEVERGIVSAGSAVPNCEIRVVSGEGEGHDCLPGQLGEVLIGGAQLLDGYLNDALSSGTFISDLRGRRYYRTGDLGFIGESGDLFLVGRLDDTVKASGYRVNLGEIEAALRQLPYLRDAAVVTIPDPVREHLLVAFVVVDATRAQGEPISARRVRTDLSAELANFQIPAVIELVENLPLNGNRKVAKALLERQALDLGLTEQ